MERCSLDGSSLAGPSTSPHRARSRSKSLAALPLEPTAGMHIQQHIDQRHAPVLSAQPSVLRKIPRPPNAFILYRSNKMRELSSKESPTGEGLSKLDYQRQLSKRIGELWRGETDEVKAIFYEKSQQAAREHAERYPEYRFKPARKAAAAKNTSPASTSRKGTADKTPERKVDTDFAPADLSGPVSGSGSGSGRKRASLEAARSKVSPYSTASRHRRASSTSPASPSLRTASHSQAQEPPTLLHYTQFDPANPSSNRVVMTRSVSQRIPTRPHIQSEGHQAKVSARKSLDGHPLAASSSHSFNTLVPGHLRDQSFIYLAPTGLPPIPIGQAITTDDTALPSDTRQHQISPKSRVSLAEAVKRALPPERRALLQASLIKRGLRPADGASSTSMEQHGGEAAQRTIGAPMSAPARSPYPSSQSTPTMVQTESWNSVASSGFGSGTEQDYYSQHPHEVFAPASHSQAQHDTLGPALDPDNQVPVSVATQEAPTVHIHMDASDAARFGDLADWTQPEACWLAYPQSQPTPQQPTHNSSGSQHDANVPRSSQRQQDQRQPTQSQHDFPPAYDDPHHSFPAYSTGQYRAVDPNSVSQGYTINSHNSAVVALSEPNESGQVQGHFYNLNGELIGHGSVNEPPIEQGNQDEMAEEERRQNLAVQQLLSQMMDASSQQSSDFQFAPTNSQAQEYWSTQAAYDPSSASFPSVLQPSQTQSMAQDQSSWQAWPADFLSTPGVKEEPDNGQIFAFNEGSATMYDDIHEASQANFVDSQHEAGPSHSQQHVPNVTPLQATGTANIGSPVQLRLPLYADTNFSRPMLFESQAHAASARAAQAAQESSSLEAAGLVTSSAAHRQEEPSSPTKTSHGLRSWKTSQLNSIKEKFARIKHRNTTASTSATSPDGGQEQA